MVGMQFVYNAYRQMQTFDKFGTGRYSKEQVYG
jgi:hypothetical protein